MASAGKPTDAQTARLEARKLATDSRVKLMVASKTLQRLFSLASLPFHERLGTFNARI